MPRVTNAVTTTTNSSLLVDAGAVYINIGLADERLLGATQGGNSFVIETEYHTPEIDSMKGNLKGATRIVGVNAKLTTNIIALTTDNIKLALAGSTSATASAPAAVGTNPPLGTAAANAHTKFTRSGKLASTDYVTNIALVGEVSGKNENVIIILKNVLALGSIEFGFEDRGEVVVPVEFTAHFDPASPLAEPWEIYYPNS